MLAYILAAFSRWPQVPAGGQPNVFVGVWGGEVAWTHDSTYDNPLID